jgi:hypothetical protein
VAKHQGLFLYFENKKCNYICNMIATNYLAHNPLLGIFTLRVEKLQSERGLVLSLSSVKNEDMIVRSSCLQEALIASVFCSKLNKLSNMAGLVAKKVKLNSRFICNPINPSGLKNNKSGLFKSNKETTAIIPIIVNPNSQVYYRSLCQAGIRCGL